MSTGFSGPSGSNSRSIRNPAQAGGLASGGSGTTLYDSRWAPRGSSGDTKLRPSDKSVTLTSPSSNVRTSRNVNVSGAISSIAGETHTNVVESTSEWHDPFLKQIDEVSNSMDVDFANVSNSSLSFICFLLYRFSFSIPYSLFPILTLFVPKIMSISRFYFGTRVTTSKLFLANRTV